MNPVNEKIRQRREKLGMSQVDLEAKAQLPQARVSKWEKGTGEPTATQAWALARALLCPLEWLCDPNATGEPPASSLPADEIDVLDEYRNSRDYLSSREICSLIAEERGRRKAVPQPIKVKVTPTQHLSTGQEPGRESS